jgi:hypothetical protein
MSIIPNWVIVVITVLVFGIVFVVGRTTGINSAELKYSKKTITSLEDAALRERELRATLETERGRLRIVSGKLQDALNGKEVVYVDVIHNITKEIEKPVYSQCFVPASGLQLAGENAARLNATRSTKN